MNKRRSVEKKNQLRDFDLIYFRTRASSASHVLRRSKHTNCVLSAAEDDMRTRDLRSESNINKFVGWNLKKIWKDYFYFIFFLVSFNFFVADDVLTWFDMKQIIITDCCHTFSRMHDFKTQNFKIITDMRATTRRRPKESCVLVWNLPNYSILETFFLCPRVLRESWKKLVRLADVVWSVVCHSFSCICSGFQRSVISGIHYHIK